VNGVHDMAACTAWAPSNMRRTSPCSTRVGKGGLRVECRWALAEMESRRIRHEIELLPPSEYLRMSYYEKWNARSSRFW